MNCKKNIIIRNKKFKNRFVIPPIVTFTFSKDKGKVSKKHIEHYNSLSIGGAAIVIVEATCIDKDGRLSNDQLGIWDDIHIEGLKKITQIIRKNNSKPFIQLHHAGMKTRIKSEAKLKTASDYKDRGLLGFALEISEIEDIIIKFKNAAIRAYKAGFEGVEIHAAHSYLISQFLSKKVNKRKDRFGGTANGRLLITKRIIEEIRKYTSEEFIIGIRMGCNENSLEDSINHAKYFEKIGYDYLSISTGFDNTEIERELPSNFILNWIVYGGTLIRNHVNIPVIVVNKILNKKQIDFLIENKLTDFIAIGRAQLADYNFVKNVFKNKQNKCLECRPCRWFSNPHRCPVNKEIYNE